MITEFFKTQEQAWNFAIGLNKEVFQVIEYGKQDLPMPYYVTYAPRF